MSRGGCSRRNHNK
eukprot:gene26721-biopygen17224